MTYPPSSSGYPPGQQPTQQFSAPTQQFGKAEQPQAQATPRAGRRRPEQAAALPARRRRSARPGRVSVQLRADVHDQRHRLPAAGQRQRHVVGSRARRRRFAARRAARRCQPAAQAEGCRWGRRGGVRTRLPAGGRRNHQQARRRQHWLGPLRRHRVDVSCRQRWRSVPCCSTRASSRRPRRGRSTSSSSTASTAGRASITVSSRTSSELPSISVRDIRRNTAAATRVDRPPAATRAASRAARPRRRPASRPTASRRHPRPRRPARFRRSRSRRIRRISPATRRHSPGLACVTSRA